MLADFISAHYSFIKPLLGLHIFLCKIIGDFYITSYLIQQGPTTLSPRCISSLASPLSLILNISESLTTRLRLSFHLLSEENYDINTSMYIKAQ